MQQEFALCSRLAGEALANALFVADARVAEACASTLSPAARKALESARTAISRAARSGLVLLTSSKPGLEPVEHLDVDRTLRLAKTMLRRIEPDTPAIEIAEPPERMPTARMPIGLPCRLLVRAIACFPTAGTIEIDLGRRQVRGLERIRIRFRSDVRHYEGWIPHVRDLLEHPGGSLVTDEHELQVELPASLECETESSGTDAFLSGRRKRDSNAPSADDRKIP